MKKKLIFDQAHELKVLNLVFGMFKYGTEIDDRKIEVICSPIFRNIYNDIHRTYIEIVSEKQVNLTNQNDIEYIEDNPIQFNIMKEYFLECKAMIDSWEGMSWNKLKKDKQVMFVINLASPFSIREETIEIFLAEKSG